MSGQVLAAPTIEVGEHPEAHFLGMTFNIDTIIGTIIAGAIVVGLGLLVRARVTSGVPSGAQLFYESVTGFIQNQIESTFSIRIPKYMLPIALTLFVFILASNWLMLLPIHHWLEPPTADVNLTFALAILVVTWMHIDGARKRGGPHKQFIHVAKGHYPKLAPLWILEQFTNTLALTLRLFGNILAGGIMLSLFTMLPAAIEWLPMAGWKLFDLFIGGIQALIFALLAIVYFAESTGPSYDEGAH